VKIEKSPVKTNVKQKSENIRKWYRYQFFGSAKVRVPKEKKVIVANIANISFSGIGLYSTNSIGKGKTVKIKISFVDKHGKVIEEVATGKVDWQSKFKTMYLIGIFFDNELSVVNQPNLIKHLTWLIDTYNWPQPYKDQRISML
jgi:uncharacterized protein YcsI (UPF0317 family)